MHKITNALYKSLFLLIALIAFSTFPIKSAYSQYTCIPTCDVTDSRFMALSGAGLETANNTDAFFHITSIDGNQEFEIGIFDGDATTRWDIDNAPFAQLEFTLYFDPNGNGTGEGNGVVYDTWSSDGTFGDNIGDPMPDNDWFIRTLANDKQARTEQGSFSYVLKVRNLNPGALAVNVFKVRSDGIVSIPAGEAFNYMVTFRTLEDLGIIYPNFDFTDPLCFNPAPPPVGFGIRQFCNPADPACCLHETTYDGTWDFHFNSPEGINTLDIWDGDLDFGSSSANADASACIKPDGVSLDTDDPNTPIPLPVWALGTDAITQSASIPTNPADDNDCSPANNRPPSVIYELIDPNGMVYMNDNPSGNIEWELFNLSTNPFNPNLYDIHVDNIPPGQWTIHTIGNNLQNLNSMRVPYAVCALDEQGEPLCPVGPGPRMVPTLNEWGLLTLSAFVLLISVYYLRFRERKAIS